MFLHYSDSDIAKLGHYDAAEFIKNAVEVKEGFEMLIMQVNGINPAELDHYSRYFTGTETEVDEDKIIENDMKEFEEISKVLAGMNVR